jgi:hypothetical protein
MCVFEHDAVIGGVECAFEVRLHYPYVFVVYFSVLHHDHEGSECFVGATEQAETILLVEYTLCFGVF